MSLEVYLHVGKIPKMIKFEVGMTCGHDRELTG
jgi:hypothetical protein